MFHVNIASVEDIKKLARRNGYFDAYDFIKDHPNTKYGFDNDLKMLIEKYLGGRHYDDVYDITTILRDYWNGFIFGHNTHECQREANGEKSQYEEGCYTVALAIAGVTVAMIAKGEASRKIEYISDGLGVFYVAEDIIRNYAKR